MRRAPGRGERARNKDVVFFFFFFFLLSRRRPSPFGLGFGGSGEGVVARTEKFWGLFSPRTLHQQAELRREREESGCDEKLSWFRGVPLSHCLPPWGSLGREGLRFGFNRAGPLLAPMRRNGGEGRVLVPQTTTQHNNPPPNFSYLYLPTAHLSKTLCCCCAQVSFGRWVSLGFGDMEKLSPSFLSGSTLRSYVSCECVLG